MLSASANSPRIGFSQAEPKHVPALDGLRGLAILLVLFRHLGYTAGKDQSWWIQSISGITLSGLIGVDLFFVLSGFLITGILFDALGYRHYFKTFYMRRFLRIFPLYYGYLLLLLLLTHPLHLSWHRNLPVLLTYTQNIFLQKPYSVLWYYTGQFWSLAVEEQFYIVWPLIVFAVRDRRQLMWVCVILSVLAIACRVAMILSGVSTELIYRLTPCRMDSLLIGSWLSLAVRGPARPALGKFARPAFAACLLLFVAFRIVQTISSSQLIYLFHTVGYSVIAIGFASLLTMALQAGSWTATLCSSSGLRWLGRYSYGIYVLHLGALHAATAVVREWRPLSQWLGRMQVVPLGIAVLSASLSLTGAWISYNFYESHFLKLKKFFRYPRERQQPLVNG